MPDLTLEELERSFLEKFAAPLDLTKSGSQTDKVMRIFTEQFPDTYFIWKLTFTYALPADKALSDQFFAHYTKNLLASQFDNAAGLPKIKLRRFLEQDSPTQVDGHFQIPTIPEATTLAGVHLAMATEVGDIEPKFRELIGLKAPIERTTYYTMQHTQNAVHSCPLTITLHKGEKLETLFADMRNYMQRFRVHDPFLMPSNTWHKGIDLQTYFSMVVDSAYLPKISFCFHSPSDSELQKPNPMSRFVKPAFRHVFADHFPTLLTCERSSFLRSSTVVKLKVEEKHPAAPQLNGQNAKVLSHNPQNNHYRIEMENKAIWELSSDCLALNTLTEGEMEPRTFVFSMNDYGRFYDPTYMKYWDEIVAAYFHPRRFVSHDGRRTTAADLAYINQQKAIATDKLNARVTARIIAPIADSEEFLVLCTRALEKEPRKWTLRLEKTFIEDMQAKNRDMLRDSKIVMNCLVCMQTNISEVFMPCGHACCCKDCSSQLNNCPLCRTPITARLPRNSAVTLDPAVRLQGVMPEGHMPCKQCGTPTKQKCSGCKKMYYCSRECQKQDWKAHKVACKAAKNATQAKSAS